MVGSNKTNVVPIKKEGNTKKSSTEAIWGAAVYSHGYAGIPSILIQCQRRLGLNPTQMVLILHLLEYWRDKSRIPYPSKQALADRTGLNAKTIQRNMRDLEEAGYLKRIKTKTAAGDWGSNKYDLSGLVRKVKELEPEFADIRAKKKAMAAKVVTPKGKRTR